LGRFLKGFVVESAVVCLIGGILKGFDTVGGTAVEALFEVVFNKFVGECFFVRFGKSGVNECVFKVFDGFAGWEFSYTGEEPFNRGFVLGCGYGVGCGVGFFGGELRLSCCDVG